MARLLLDVLRDSRKKRRFELHEFVIMPDHIHFILTPSPKTSLEKAMQFIKGGFSFRAKRELKYGSDVWERSFTEHRIKSADEYQSYRAYVRENPLKARIIKPGETYQYSSAATEVDPIPPWLKPLFKAANSQG